MVTANSECQRCFAASPRIENAMRNQADLAYASDCLGRNPTVTAAMPGCYMTLSYWPNCSKGGL